MSNEKHYPLHPGQTLLRDLLGGMMKKRITKRTSMKKVNINVPIAGRISGLKFIGLDMAKKGERDKCYASFVRFIKNGIVIEGSKPIIMDELESLVSLSRSTVELDRVLLAPYLTLQDVPHFTPRQ